MRLPARLARLERAAAAVPTGVPCAGCGGTGEPMGRICLRVQWSDEPADRPDRCPACGRLLRVRIEFDKAG